MSDKKIVINLSKKIDKLIETELKKTKFKLEDSAKYLLAQRSLNLCLVRNQGKTQHKLLLDLINDILEIAEE